MTGVYVLVGALVACVALALLMRFKNGRFSSTAAMSSAARTATPDAALSRELLAPADLGIPLGDKATLVQFSSSFCSPCRATRAVLTDLVAQTEGIGYVDIDAESHLDLVRRLNILRTPTVLVLDSSGGIVERASGLPRKVDVIAALGRAIN
ncbi:hypothetical protein BH09ACT10_BH09ACT10_22520 [soil metagenome]